MNLALGIALMWLGGALLWVAFHGIGDDQHPLPVDEVMTTLRNEIAPE
jgi:hypothetical protein